MAERKNRYKLNPYGVYHILIRGSRASMKLFVDVEDVNLYRDILMRMREEGLVVIYAVSIYEEYCHLLVKEGSISIPEFKKKVANMYYKHYNMKYSHRGNVFRDHADTQSVMTRNLFRRCVEVMGRGNAKLRMVFADSLDELEDMDFQDAVEVRDFKSKAKVMNFQSCLIYLTTELNYKGLADFRTWTDESKRDFVVKAVEAGVSEKFIGRFTELSSSDYVLRK